MTVRRVIEEFFSHTFNMGAAHKPPENTDEHINQALASLRKIMEGALPDRKTDEDLDPILDNQAFCNMTGYNQAIDDMQANLSRLLEEKE